MKSVSYDNIIDVKKWLYICVGVLIVPNLILVALSIYFASTMFSDFVPVHAANLEYLWLFIGPSLVVALAILLWRGATHHTSSMLYVALVALGITILIDLGVGLCWIIRINQLPASIKDHFFQYRASNDVQFCNKWLDFRRRYNCCGVSSVRNETTIYLCEQVSSCSASSSVKDRCDIVLIRRTVRDLCILLIYAFCIVLSSKLIVIIIASKEVRSLFKKLEQAFNDMTPSKKSIESLNEIPIHMFEISIGGHKKTTGDNEETKSIQSSFNSYEGSKLIKKFKYSLQPKMASTPTSPQNTLHKNDAIRLTSQNL